MPVAIFLVWSLLAIHFLMKCAKQKNVRKPGAEAKISNASTMNRFDMAAQPTEMPEDTKQETSKAENTVKSDVPKATEYTGCRQIPIEPSECSQSQSIQVSQNGSIQSCQSTQIVPSGEDLEPTRSDSIQPDSVNSTQKMLSTEEQVSN